MPKTPKYEAMTDEELAEARTALLEENIRLTNEREAALAKFRAGHERINGSLDKIDRVLQLRRVVGGMSDEQRVELAEMLKAGG
jgi:hypothetical protein